MGGALNIKIAIRELEETGVAAIHIEDQVQQKRCGQRPNKAIVSQQEMVDRIKAAVDAKHNQDFVIIARTDALAVERACAYIDAGADMLFLEVMQSLDQYKTLSQVAQVPILANITELGQTPLFGASELASVGVKMQLFCLSALCAMSLVALKTYQKIATKGHQRDFVDSTQTREELYQVLNYRHYENKLDELFIQENSKQTPNTNQ